MSRTRVDYQHLSVEPVVFSQRRLKLLRNLMLVAFAIILVRLFFIQVIEHPNWVAKANEEHTILETIPAKRGEIYMLEDGQPVPVALNQSTYQIIIDPAVTDQTELTNALNKYAKDYISADLEQVYSTEGLRYAIVARNLPKSVADQVAAENLAATWFKATNQRVYPEGNLASGLLGFVNADGLGQYGVEGSLNSLIGGQDGTLRSLADVNKVALSIGSDNIKIPATDGQDVVLSVDRSLQSGIESIMQNILDTTIATNSSVLVMRPDTGQVLAMANLPNYDPADYGNVKDASAYTNFITETPYEPASICKNFAFSAAINEGKMTPETTYNNLGYEEVDGWKINNADQRSVLLGTRTMKEALYWSLNTGSIYALKLLGDNPNAITQTGRERLYDYYHNKFRLGQATGIELIEGEGFIPDPNEGWGRDSTYANMTFGQNLGVTMLQTATAFSAIVNGGTYHTPSILAGTLKNGQITPYQNPDHIDDQILTPETSATMRGMLINNRDYKRRLNIDPAGYDIGGKSGTAQVIVDGAYDDTMSNLVGSYIGFIAPQGEMPEYVIMVKLGSEGHAIEGEDASYLFDAVSNYVIKDQKIKPNA